MRDKQVFLKFCEYLRGLLKAGLPLRDSLEILASSNYDKSAGNGRRLALFTERFRFDKNDKLAEKVLSFMKRGYSFSSALSVNGVVHVDERLCSLIAAADKAGNLCEMFGFICDSESEKTGFMSKLVGLCIYPLGIVLLAGVGSFFLVKNCSLLGFKAIPTGVFPGFVSSVIFIALFTVCFFGAAVKTNAENLQLSFFNPLSFFLSCGFDLKNALSLVSIGSGYKNASLCSRLLHNLSCGMPFSRSLKEQNCFSEETIAFIALAEKTGRLVETCRTVASRIAESEKQKRLRFIRFGEPALLSAVGVYVLVLAQNVILPFITNFDYML